MSDLSLSEDRSKATASDPASSRYYNCPVCGQRVDRVNLDQVYYHDEQPHEPLSADSTRYDLKG